MSGRIMAVSALAAFAAVACGERAARLLERRGPVASGYRMEQQPMTVAATAIGAGSTGEVRFRFGGPDAPAAMVIRSGAAAIEVDSLERALGAVRILAARVGGYIADTRLQGGEGQLRSATLEVKMPAARFDDALSGLQPIGKVESVNVTAEDVGEEYVDVAARVENARRLEQRLLGILANRTGKLHDVLEVEQELSRVREEIERHEGRLRYLRAHAATSTLAITVHEPAPVVGLAGASPLGEAARQAWRNFIALIAFGIQALGVMVPLGALAAIAWPLVRRLRRAAA